MNTFLLQVLVVVFLTPTLALRATNFYVDSYRGKDSTSGTSLSNPWQTLEKVSATKYSPGDHIFFKAGSRWVGQLAIRSSGTAGRPIIVDRYGKGSRPRLDGEGRVEDVILLQNVEQIEIHNLEVTNHGGESGVRRGVLVAEVNYGTAHHLVIADLYIHDVNGTNALKETGGIVFRIVGDTVRSRFDDLLIERNIIWKVDRSAIAAQSSEFARSRWYPSLHVVIRDNYADDIGGDGIVPWATDGAMIEHNIVLHCNQRAGSYNAGIWPWSTDNSLFQLNEAAFTHSTRDGEGFDSDYNSRNTHFIYNYSHDNDGGFMLICTPGKRNAVENVGNTGTLIEYNISRNDHARIFNLSGADRTTVDHNMIYIAPGDDVQVLLVSNWNGWSNDAVFRSNTFNVAGVGRYGHQLKGDPDGTYQIASGWGGATNIRFEGNSYFGRNIDLPDDPRATVDDHVHETNVDFREPTFHPANPENFTSFMAMHRKWMLDLFTSQFGRPPQLRVPQPLSIVEVVDGTP